MEERWLRGKNIFFFNLVPPIIRILDLCVFLLDVCRSKALKAYKSEA